MVETHGTSERQKKSVGRRTEFGGRRDDRLRSVDVLATGTRGRRAAHLALAGLATERTRGICL